MCKNLICLNCNKSRFQYNNTYDDHGLVCQGNIFAYLVEKMIFSITVIIKIISSLDKEIIIAKIVEKAALEQFQAIRII